MQNEWIERPILTPLSNPQAHWLRETEEIEAWTPVVLAVAPAQARAIGAHFSALHGLPAPPGVDVTASDLGQHGAALEEALQATRMGPETLNVLLGRGAQGGGPVPTGSGEIEITVLVESQYAAALQNLPADQPLRVVEVGPSTSVDVYGPPVPAWYDTVDRDNEYLKHTKAIVAIIDDGIAFANQRFRQSPTETRVEFFWSMDLPGARATDLGRNQANIWEKPQIDGFLARFDGDEEAIYRATGLLDAGEPRRQPLWFSRTHGTHVLDIAAGCDFSDEERDRFPILAVQLPSQVVTQTSGSLTAIWLELALERILQEAIKLARRVARAKGDVATLPPLLLNFSFGVFAGPKDGTSRVERSISNFISRYRALEGHPACHVVLPAGNSLQSRTQARLTLSNQGQTSEIDWCVLPDDRTASFVHIWLPPDTPDAEEVRVAIAPPNGGPALEAFSRRDHVLDWVKDGSLLARIYHQRVTGFNGPREWIVIAVRPSESDDNREDFVPSGLWRIRVENRSVKPGTGVDLMIQRDDSIRDHRQRGRQSYFEHPDYVRYDPVTGRPAEADNEKSPVKREGTLSAYASLCKTHPKGGNGPHCADDLGDCDPIVVGGYVSTTGKALDYSSSGPVVSGRQGPSSAAASETSRALPGTLAAGTYNNSVIIQRGTSVAAPALLRALATAISKGRSLEDLMDEVRKDESNGIGGPHGRYEKLRPGDDKRMGIGRLAAAVPSSNRRRLSS